VTQCHAGVNIEAIRRRGDKLKNLKNEVKNNGGA